MKSILLVICVLFLMSCGKKDSDSQPDQATWNMCGGSIIYKACERRLMPVQYIIVSKQRLPEKIKVFFKRNELKYQAFDQCSPGAITQHFLSSGVSMLGFQINDIFDEEGMSIEIVDAGENCDKDAIFFDESIRPVQSDSWENTRLTLTFNLEN